MSTNALDPLWNRILFDQAAFGGTTAGLAQQTAGGLIYAALRKAAVTLGPGRTASPAQMKDAIDELRRLTGSLNCDRLFIYALDVLPFPLTGQESYTIGQDPAGGEVADWDVPRPQLLTKAVVVNNSGARDEMPLLTPQTWIEAQNGGTGVYNDRASPLSRIYVYGAPDGAMIELSVWHQVPIFQSETDAVLIPLQYEDALVLNLACRLGPQFQKAVHPDLREQARESMMRLLSINAPQPIADTSGFGFGCGCDYDIYRR